jgi:hypothetical protein
VFHINKVVRNSQQMEGCSQRKALSSLRKMTEDGVTEFLKLEQLGTTVEPSASASVVAVPSLGLATHSERKQS